jgi:hypothetical protein
MKRRQSLKTLKNKLWKLFSLCGRLEAADYRGMVQCYTCGKEMHYKESQWGHAIGGRHNAVLFDPEICRVQCVGCNIFLRGNYTIYTTKLIQENGIEWMENKLIQSRAPVKYTQGDLELKIEEYEKRLEDLEGKRVA